MKKILTAVFLFCMVFIIALIFFFPYADYISHALEEAKQTKGININWTNSIKKFPGTLLENVNISSKQGELINFDKLKLGFNPISGVTFDGQGAEVSLRGNYKNGKINFDLRNYSLPEFIAANMGEGVFHIKGVYDIRANSGTAEFSGSIKKIPTPLLTQPLNVAGTATKNGNISEIIFDATGSNITGSGKIAITEQQGRDSDISGSIQLKLGVIPLNLRIGGTLGSLKISAGL